jgi:hypothetical protein
MVTAARIVRLGLMTTALLAAWSASAQEARVRATADTNAIRVGEQFHVTVSVEHPPGTVVRNVGPTDSLKGLVIVRIDSAAGPSPDPAGPFTRVFTVTAFDTGTWVLPPFTAWYASAADKAVRTATGPPVLIAVHGVAVDTSSEIKAIKPPLAAPISFAELLPYIVAVVLAALLGWLVYYILKKRRRGEKFIPAAPPRPADELALEALRAIEADRLWQRGMVKEYHSGLTDVLRTYIERSCAMPAMESTSDEILSSPAVSTLAAAPVEALRDVLRRADLVKFAKFVPSPGENEKSFAESVSFVELTRKLPRPTAGRGGDAAAETPAQASVAMPGPTPGTAVEGEAP